MWYEMNKAFTPVWLKRIGMTKSLKILISYSIYLLFHCHESEHGSKYPCQRCSHDCTEHQQEQKWIRWNPWNGRLKSARPALFIKGCRLTMTYGLMREKEIVGCSNFGGNLSASPRPRREVSCKIDQRHPSPYEAESRGQSALESALPASRRNIMIFVNLS